MSCEGQDYRNMSYEELHMHARFHHQKAGEVATAGEEKRYQIEQLREQIMSNAATEALMPGQMKVSDGNVSGVGLKVYIAGLQMQLTVLEAEGGQING